MHLGLGSVGPHDVGHVGVFEGFWMEILLSEAPQKGTEIQHSPPDEGLGTI